LSYFIRIHAMQKHPAALCAGAVRKTLPANPLRRLDVLLRLARKETGFTLEEVS
jgi:hypothetical protein